MKGRVVSMLVLGLTGMVWTAPAAAWLTPTPGHQVDNAMRPVPDDSFPVLPDTTRTRQQSATGNEALGPGVRFEVRVGGDAVAALRQGQTVESQFRVPNPSGTGLLPASAVGEVALLLKANEGQDNLPAVGMQLVPTAGDTLRFELTDAQLSALQAGSLNYTIPMNRRNQFTRVEFVGTSSLGDSFAQPAAGANGTGQVLPPMGMGAPGETSFMGPVHPEQFSAAGDNFGGGKLKSFNEQVTPPGLAQTTPASAWQTNPPLAQQGNLSQGNAWDSPSLDVRPPGTADWQGTTDGSGFGSPLTPPANRLAVDQRSGMAAIPSPFGQQREDFQNVGQSQPVTTQQELAQYWNALQAKNAQLDQRELAQAQQAGRLQRLEQQLQTLLDGGAPPERLAERRPLEDQIQPVDSKLNTQETSGQLGSRLPQLPTPTSTGDPSDGLAEAASRDLKAERGREMGAVYLLLLASLGLNAYLGLLCRSFYYRYNDLSDELRETFTTSVV